MRTGLTKKIQIFDTSPQSPNPKKCFEKRKPNRFFKTSMKTRLDKLKNENCSTLV